jgi:hypothetical protein
VRILPQWYCDGGSISIYYTSRTLLPAKTRVFVDFVVEAFRRDRLAEQYRTKSSVRSPTEWQGHDRKL